jgi:hypothetical protein
MISTLRVNSMSSDIGDMLSAVQFVQHTTDSMSSLMSSLLSFCSSCTFVAFMTVLSAGRRGSKFEFEFHVLSSQGWLGIICEVIGRD